MKGLIDSLVEMSQKARDCLHDGKLFPANGEYANIDVECL